MKRQRSQSTQKRDQELMALIMPIKTDHPLWATAGSGPILNTGKAMSSALTAFTGS